MEFLEASHKEWCDMWEDLSLQAVNHGDPICLSQGSCWEYMGSTLDHHHFRHLAHPHSGTKEFIYIERRQLRFAWAV